MCFQERFREVFSSFIIYDISSTYGQKNAFPYAFPENTGFLPQNEASICIKHKLRSHTADAPFGANEASVFLS